jgi:hypothetical protein
MTSKRLLHNHKVEGIKPFRQRLIKPQKKHLKLDGMQASILLQIKASMLKLHGQIFQKKKHL